MSKLHIELPAKVKAAAESRAARGNSTLDAYVESLIIADAIDEFGVPDHLNVFSTDQLTRLLKEGQASPAHEMTTTDWDEMRQRLVAQHRSSKAG